MPAARHTAPPPTLPLLWDVFCRVVDNFGDIGVCWRLAVNLAARGQQVRLWVDDASALRWMAPGALEGQFSGIQVLDWEESRQADTLEDLPAADVWVETFGCEIAPELIAVHAYSTRADDQNGIRNRPIWINLEYLTAEGFAERAHTLPSPVMSGPAAGRTPQVVKHFFYPGFTSGTGGLLREADLASQQASFDRADWLSRQGIDWQGERLVSLFCYEPAALHEFLRQLRNDSLPTRLLVTHGRATDVVRNIGEIAPKPPSVLREQLSISYLPALTQTGFDHLLWACDLNFVRGEDSLVRAIWAGKPFVWQIYPQSDGVHHLKLDAFLTMLGADGALRRFHHVWNGQETAAPPALTLVPWQKIVTSSCDQLRAQDDLATQLLHFVAKNR
jgi:uncharacterized repeat protein (TIGR03837 family)